MGTLLTESAADYLKQINGPALGFYQMESGTYQDNLKWLRFPVNKKLRERCLAACFYDMEPPETALIDNLRWATVITRVDYYRDPQLIPVHDDILGLAQYWKRAYNSLKGDGEPGKFMELLAQYKTMYPQPA